VGTIWRSNNWQRRVTFRELENLTFASYLFRGGSAVKKYFRNIFGAISILFASFSCSGCHKPQSKFSIALDDRPLVSVTVVISSDFTDSQRKSIIKGVEMWEQATNGAVITHIIGISRPHSDNVLVRDIVVIFKKTTSDEPNVKTWDDQMKPTMLLGLASYEETNPSELTLVTAWIVTDRLINEQYGVWISAHEFGHALGLHHIDDTHSIMSPVRSEATWLTEKDAREFCVRYDGCRVVY